MFKRYLIYENGALQFVVLCAITSLSFLIGGALISLLNDTFLNLSIEDLLKLKSIPNEIGNYLKWSNTAFLAIGLLLPALLFAYLTHPKPLTYLTWHVPQKAYHWLWGITLLAIALPFSSALEQWSEFIPYFASPKDEMDQYNKMATSMLAGTTVKDFLANIVAIALLPALIEELFFRACLQNVLINWMRKTPISAIIIVAILFSAFHGQLSGFLPRVFLGLVLGLAYYYSGSIWLSILLHFLNNFIAVVFIWLNHRHALSIDIDKLPEINIYFGILSGIATFVFAYYFYQHRVKHSFHELPDEQEPLNN